jgi:hypothetical protein
VTRPPTVSVVWLTSLDEPSVTPYVKVGVGLLAMDEARQLIAGCLTAADQPGTKLVDTTGRVLFGDLALAPPELRELAGDIAAAVTAVDVVE